MGNSSSGPQGLTEADVYRFLVEEVQGTLNATGAVDPRSVRFANVLGLADERLIDDLQTRAGMDAPVPGNSPYAREEKFNGILDQLQLAPSDAQRLRQEYRYTVGPGASALKETGASLDAQGQPDPASVDPQRLSQAAVARHRADARVGPNDHLGNLLDELDINGPARLTLQQGAHIDTRKFSWISTGMLTSEMGSEDRYRFERADERLTDANNKATTTPFTNADRQAMLTTDKDRWQGAVRDMYRNDPSGLKAIPGAETPSFNYPKSDFTHTGAATAARLFEPAVEAGYNLKDREVLKQYLEAVNTHTSSSLGHQTQFAGRTVAGQQGQTLSTQSEMDMGERQYNNSAAGMSRR